MPYLDYRYQKKQNIFVRCLSCFVFCTFLVYQLEGLPWQYCLRKIGRSCCNLEVDSEIPFQKYFLKQKKDFRLLN